MKEERKEGIKKNKERKKTDIKKKRNKGTT